MTEINLLTTRSQWVFELSEYPRFPRGTAHAFDVLKSMRGSTYQSPHPRSFADATIFWHVESGKWRNQTCQL